MSTHNQAIKYELKAIKSYLTIHDKKYLFFIFLFMLLDLVRMKWQGEHEPGTLAFILAFVFIYRINVEEKISYTWNTFHALPLNLFSRIFLKMVLPFVFICVFMMAYSFPNLSEFQGSNLLDALLDFSILVVASVLAHSFIGFLGYFLLGNVLLSLTQELYTLPLLNLSLIWAIGIYGFSGKRVTFKGLMLFLVIPALLLNLVWFFISGGQLGSHESKGRRLLEQNDDGIEFNIYFKNKI